jgi:hypothetical protein
VRFDRAADDFPQSASGWKARPKVWVLEFAWDTLATARRFRVFAVAEPFTREWLLAWVTGTSSRWEGGADY